MNDKWLSPEDAYRNDLQFRAVVDAMEGMVHRAELTPAEVRAAAVLACIHYELRSARPLMVPVPFDEKRTIEFLTAAEERIRELKRWIDDGEKREPSEGRGI